MKNFQQFLESKSVFDTQFKLLIQLLTNYEVNESVYRIDSDRINDFAQCDRHPVCQNVVAVDY